MSHIAAYPQTHRFWGLISAVLFILTIPLGNWVVMNVGLVCLKDGPCLVPVLPVSWRRRLFCSRALRSFCVTPCITASAHAGRFTAFWRALRFPAF